MEKESIVKAVARFFEIQRKEIEKSKKKDPNKSKKPFHSITISEKNGFETIWIDEILLKGVLSYKVTKEKKSAITTLEIKIATKDLEVNIDNQVNVAINSSLVAKEITENIKKGLAGIDSF